MIDYELYAKIRHAHEKEHLNVRQIAKKLKIDRKTARRWIDRPSFAPGRPARGPQKPKASKLDGFKGRIMGLLETHAYTAAQLLPRLRGEGYTGGYSILKEYVAAVRPKSRPAFLKLHFEPGQCAQVDWGCAGPVQVGGTRRMMSFFVMVLCHSRYMYVEFTLGQSQEQWLACHQRAFDYFGGLCPAEIMCDNLKTAVLSHPVGGPVVLNPRYADFARHYRLKINACGPYRGNEKGRVECAVKFVKGSFLRGNELKDFASFNPAVQQWLETVANVRIHGETKQRPVDVLAEEKKALRPVPAAPYDTAVVKTVPVSNQCRVKVDTNTYTVPSKYASRLLTLKLYSDRLRLFDQETLVAEHVRCYDRRKDSEHPDHVRAIASQRRKAERGRNLVRFFRLSPRAQSYYEQLSERRMNAAHHVQKILALAEIYGGPAVRRAIEDAHDLSAFSSEYICNLLEQRARFQPETAALHLTRGCAESR